jgi:hypothetical protein
VTIIVWVLEWLAVPAIRYAAVALGALAIGGLWLWRHDVRVADQATAAIERKAEEHVKTADDVRSAVAAGARGMRDPNRRDRDAKK